MSHISRPWRGEMSGSFCFYTALAEHFLCVPVTHISGLNALNSHQKWVQLLHSSLPQSSERQSKLPKATSKLARELGLLQTVPDTGKWRRVHLPCSLPTFQTLLCSSPSPAPCLRGLASCLRESCHHCESSTAYLLSGAGFWAFGVSAIGSAGKWEDPAPLGPNEPDIHWEKVTGWLQA